MLDVLDLCTRFGVDLKSEIDRSTGFMVLYFGDRVTWSIRLEEGISQYDLYEISLRLAATYPEKVLPKED